MGVVRVKNGVQFTVIAPAGFRILSALDQTATKLDVDLIITSACDGQHSGPEDPHKKGEAYDVRSQGFTADEKDDILTEVMGILGWEHFFGFLEAPDTDDEHFHIQRKKGTVYP